MLTTDHYLCTHACRRTKEIDNSRCEVVHVVHVTTRYIWNALRDSLDHDLAVGHLIGESISLSVIQLETQLISHSVRGTEAPSRFRVAIVRLGISESISSSVSVSVQHSLITRLSHGGGGMSLDTIWLVIKLVAVLFAEWRLRNLAARAQIVRCSVMLSYI